MLFSTPTFWLFLVAVFVGHALCRPPWRWLPLLLASTCFYGCFGWIPLFILAAVTA